MTKSILVFDTNLLGTSRTHTHTVFFAVMPSFFPVFFFPGKDVLGGCVPRLPNRFRASKEPSFTSQGLTMLFRCRGLEVYSRHDCTMTGSVRLGFRRLFAASLGSKRPWLASLLFFFHLSIVDTVCVPGHRPYFASDIVIVILLLLLPWPSPLTSPTPSPWNLLFMATVGLRGKVCGFLAFFC